MKRHEKASLDGDRYTHIRGHIRISYFVMKLESKGKDTGVTAIESPCSTVALSRGVTLCVTKLNTQ